MKLIIKKLEHFFILHSLILKIYPPQSNIKPNTSLDPKIPGIRKSNKQNKIANANITHEKIRP